MRMRTCAHARAVGGGASAPIAEPAHAARAYKTLANFQKSEVISRFPTVFDPLFCIS